MEYSDFIFIGANGLSGLREPTDFLEYLGWMMQDDFQVLEEELKTRLDIKRLPKGNPDDIIAGCIYDSNKEQQKKIKDKNFYVCHANCVLYVMRRLFTENFFNTLKIADSDEHTKFLVQEYQQIFCAFLLDVEDLCSLYSCEMKGSMKYMSSYGKRYVHTASLHQVLRQGLYGNYSFHSFTDKEISATIGTIRQLVEWRLRRSVGVMAYMDNDENIQPLSMSVLFEVLKRHREEITFPIRLESLIRIYKWSNYFIHSGQRDFSWLPFYLEFVLKEFTFGKEKENGWDIQNGIRISQKTITAIQQELLDRANSKKSDPERGETIKYRLLVCKPECEKI